MSAAHVSDALVHLESMAAAGSPPDDVAHEAEAIAAGWWWNACDDLAPERLVLLVQELRRWCAVAAGRHALRWECLNQAGRPRDAEDAARWAQALDRAQRILPASSPAASNSSARMAACSSASRPCWSSSSLAQR